MRILIFSFLLLAGCGRSEQDQAAQMLPTGSPHDERIECRIGNARQFERFCSIDQEDGEAGRILVVRKPDGGFRRLLVTHDGRGVVAADGAEPAQVAIIADNRIEVAIGDDSFRLPATVRSP